MSAGSAKTNQFSFEIFVRKPLKNKTPTQALTPPAEKIGKSLTYV